MLPYTWAALFVIHICVNIIYISSCNTKTSPALQNYCNYCTFFNFFLLFFFLKLRERASVDQRKAEQREEQGVRRRIRAMMIEQSKNALDDGVEIGERSSARSEETPSTIEAEQPPKLQPQVQKRQQSQQQQQQQRVTGRSREGTPVKGAAKVKRSGSRDRRRLSAGSVDSADAPVGVGLGRGVSAVRRRPASVELRRWLTSWLTDRRTWLSQYILFSRDLLAVVCVCVCVAFLSVVSVLRRASPASGSPASCNTHKDVCFSTTLRRPSPWRFRQPWSASSAARPRIVRGFRARARLKMPMILMSALKSGEIPRLHWKMDDDIHECLQEERRYLHFIMPLVDEWWCDDIDAVQATWKRMKPSLVLQKAVQTKVQQKCWLEILLQSVWKRFASLLLSIIVYTRYVLYRGTAGPTFAMCRARTTARSSKYALSSCGVMYVAVSIPLQQL